MLRISAQDDEKTTILKIEGKLAEPWANELESTWRGLSRDSKKLCLDIRGVTFVDEKGKRILREIARTTGAEILADSPLTKHFANEVSHL